MLVRELRPQRNPWPQFAGKCQALDAAIPRLEWMLQWSPYYLSRWALLEGLEYLSILSVLFAVVAYFSESGDRQKQKHYQAWQVINTAQGKGGSGAFLQGIQLHGAKLRRASVQDADPVNADLGGADLGGANLQNADLRNTDPRGVQWQDIQSIANANNHGLRPAIPSRPRCSPGAQRCKK